MGMSHISAGRGEAAWSRSCPKRTALRASPSPDNSLDHLTSTKSCLWALCKKQHVISASGCPILPSNTFLARTKSLGSVLAVDSAPCCWGEGFGGSCLRLAGVAALASFCSGSAVLSGETPFLRPAQRQSLTAL